VVTDQQSASLTIRRASLFLSSTADRNLESLRELVAAGQTEPALLHFEEALTKLRVRLEPGLICAMFGVQTALARFPTHAYKHGAPPKAPRHPNLRAISRLLEVESIVQSGKKYIWHRSKLSITSYP
jgi:hypothetical protein